MISTWTLYLYVFSSDCSEANLTEKDIHIHSLDTLQFCKDKQKPFSKRTYIVSLAVGNFMAGAYKTVWQKKWTLLFLGPVKTFQVDAIGNHSVW